MTQPKADGNAAYHLGLFAAVSVLCGLLVAGLALPFAAIIGSGVKASANSLESLPAELAIGPQSERSRVLMADGSTLAEFYSENRVYVPLAKISKQMQVAQVAIEDDRFYSHGAIDFRGTARAALRSASGSTQGGSTLTQQYVKQVQIEASAAAGDEEGVRKATEQSIARKVKELRYAVAVEKKLTKDQILERYLNIAYYGDGAYGVEAAARHYFNTTAEKLTLAQATLLAGLVQNPVATDPVNHPTSAMNRRSIVLSRMVQLGRITEAEAAAVRRTPFDPKLVQQPKNGCVSSTFPTLCLYVTRVLTSDAFPALGKTAADRMNTLKRGGLTIKTQINPKAQASAEDAVLRRIAPADPYISTAVLIQPKTGLIVSMAQNRTKLGTGPGETWFNYAADAKHGGAEGYQAGSTFKTFTMAAALAKGFTPNQTYNAPQTLDYNSLTFQSCSGTFRPPSSVFKNSTGNGTFTMTKAAMKSINTYFVKLESAAGLCDVVKMAQAAGVKRADGKDLIKDPAPGGGTGGYDTIASFTLGSVEVTPLSMAESYATFANRGVHCDPIIIQSITTKAGKPVAVPSANCKKVMEPGVADAVNNILQQVIGPGGTANVAHLDDDRDQAAKTGTIDGAAAVWLAGYTPDMAGVSMIAVDKLAAPYKGRTNKSLTNHESYGTECPNGCWLQGSGGGDAGKIWKRAMNAALQDIEPTRFVRPGDSIMEGKKVEIDLSGMGKEEIITYLSAKGFSFEEVQVASSRPAGTFLYASPSQGTYRTSRVIQLYVSSGKERVVAPTKKATAKSTKKATVRTTTKATAKATAKPTATAKATTKPKATAKPTAKKSA